MKIGYARVSTQSQNLDLQIDALTKAGCKKIFKEKVSGVKSEREELLKVMDQLRKGDTVIIYKLDRLARSMRHLVDLVAEIEAKGANIKSLNDAMIDTTTAQGKLVFNIFASISEFERNLISERTKAGLASAKKRGRVGGRPKGLNKEAKRKAKVAKLYYEKQELSVNQICVEIGVSKATLYKYLRHEGVKIGV